MRNVPVSKHALRKQGKHGIGYRLSVIVSELFLYKALHHSFFVVHFEKLQKENETD
jgi:hypothetical protein